MVELTVEQEETLVELRGAGWAVVVVGPGELEGTAPSWVEVEMRRAAEREIAGEYEGD